MAERPGKHSRSAIASKWTKGSSRSRGDSPVVGSSMSVISSRSRKKIWSWVPRLSCSAGTMRPVSGATTVIRRSSSISTLV